MATETSSSKPQGKEPRTTESNVTDPTSSTMAETVSNLDKASQRVKAPAAGPNVTVPTSTISETVTNLDKARQRVKLAFIRSNLLDPAQDHLFPRFEWEELTLGNILGVGGFGTVKEISSISIINTKKGPSSSFSFRSWAEITNTNEKMKKIEETKQQDDNDDDDDDSEEDSYYDEAFQDKRFIAENTQRKGGEARYAIKYISTKVKADPKLFLQAAMDMAVETQFLSVLKHDHLVRMRGVGQGDMFDKEYFLVLDRLDDDTLEDRINKWALYQQELKHKPFWCRLAGYKLKKKQFWIDRMSIMNDLSSAMEYLHGLRIIYRDFKPDNIGFDFRGTVKLFDFGLAKELHPEDQRPNGTYRLTGETGAARYMAPEVMTRRPYNFTADVYSFGLVLWQCFALKLPYADFNSHMMKDMVGNFGERPPLDDKWPMELQTLIQNCWDANFRKRPDFRKVHARLQELVGPPEAPDE